MCLCRIQVLMIMFYEKSKFKESSDKMQNKSPCIYMTFIKAAMGTYNNIHICACKMKSIISISGHVSHVCSPSMKHCVLHSMYMELSQSGCNSIIQLSHSTEWLWWSTVRGKEAFLVCLFMCYSDHASLSDGGKKERTERDGIKHRNIQS